MFKAIEPKSPKRFLFFQRCFLFLFFFSFSLSPYSSPTSSHPSFELYWTRKFVPAGNDGETSLNALYYALLPPQVPPRIRYYLASERLEYEVGSCRADFMNRNGELQFGHSGLTAATRWIKGSGFEG